jgi:hypothetical protein
MENGNWRRRGIKFATGGPFLSESIRADLFCFVLRATDAGTVPVRRAATWRRGRACRGACVLRGVYAFGELGGFAAELGRGI